MKIKNNSIYGSGNNLNMITLTGEGVFSLFGENDIICDGNDISWNVCAYVSSLSLYDWKSRDGTSADLV